MNKFKSSILNLIRPKGNSEFGIHVINGVKPLIPLRLNFCHLNEHKFPPNSNDTNKPMC